LNEILNHFAGHAFLPGGAREREHRLNPRHELNDSDGIATGSGTQHPAAKPLEHTHRFGQTHRALWFSGYVLHDASDALRQGSTSVCNP
jgi:hypothetical protein